MPTPRVWSLITLVLLTLPAVAATDLATAAVGARPDPEMSSSEQLHRLFDRDWARRLADDPLLATMSGSRKGIDRLPLVSLAEEARRAKASRAFLGELAAIPREQLGEEDLVSAEVFRWELEQHLAGFEHHEYRLGLTADSGFHTDAARWPHQLPFASTDDYRAYFARLHAFPTYVEGQIELLEAAIDAGWTLPRVVLDGYEDGIRAHIVERAEDSVFFTPLLAFTVGVPEGDRAALVEAGRVAVIEGAVAGYRRFLDFFTTRYRPAARGSLGAHELDGGAALYRHRIRHYTTLDRSADEIHQLGLAEVARIRGEMDAVRQRLGFEGDLRALFDSMRRDPQFTASSAEALLERAAWIAKRMDGKLPELFGRLPRVPYTVAPVPDYLAPKYTAGRYVQPPADGSRAGIYWVNTHDLASRPLYNLEALTLHEAVPGHHLQIALALEAVAPAFRRNLYISAFGEGWGLYAEWLGIETGFYTDPYSELGRLTYEMWRACRLVLDTGIHAFGWSRDRAIDYLASNTALSQREVESEIDRYISWPGQALAYKIGELEIRRLRRHAESRLGSGFDLRSFHDEVLRHGSVPLPVLAGIVERWITSRAATAAGAAGSSP